MPKNTIITSTQLIANIKRNRKANIPTMIFGAPGIGKSAIVHQAADGDAVIDLRLSMVEPFDLRGLPTITTDKSVQWARPSWLPTEGKGILFLDELNTAPEAVLNAALQLVLDRKCGDHKLGDGWYIVAAGNQAVHNSTVTPLSHPLINRFCVVQYEATPEGWCEWAQGAGVHPAVIGFIKFRPELLSTAPTDDYTNFATPRQWENVSRLLASDSDMTDLELFTGLVGPGPATEFVQYMGTYSAKIPDIDLLASGKSHLDTETLSATESDAVAHALVDRMERDPSRVDIRHCCKIILSMPAEIARNCLADIMKLDGIREAVMSIAECREWVRQNPHLIRAQIR